MGDREKELVEVFKNLLIAILAREGVKQEAIREIVGGDIVKVNRIARHFKKPVESNARRRRS